MKCGIAKFVVPVLMYASVCGMHVSAEEYVWVGNESSSWSDPASYELSNEDGEQAKKLPAKDDIVKLGENSSATVNDDSVAFVGSLARIMPQSGSTLVIDISTNATMGCVIAGGNSSSTTYGRLLKRGVGTLSLTAVGAVEVNKVYIDCYTSELIVEKGGVVFPQQSVSGTAKNYQLGNCTVGEGCFMKLSGGFNTYMTSLNGCGTVISDSTSSRTLRVNGSGQSLFFGKIEGANLSFEVYNGKADLTGAESTFAKTFSVNKGEVGVTDFGSVGSDSSSIGKDISFSVKEDGGTVRYLGTVSGVVDKDIKIYPGDTNAAPFTFDAGSFGGLKFTGDWSMSNNNKIPARMKRIVLTGSNTVECVLENAISGATASETNYSFSITKKGRGVWRMANNENRRFSGSVMVDEGTLRFDSIGETNEVCSLGLATDTYGELQGVKPESPLPYAIRLGSGEAEGVFEYTGDGFSQTKTRKIGLAGNARILHNGDNGFIRLLGGISAVTSGDKILALDGDGTNDCEVADVDDGDGRVSVVKEGSGVWALTGRQSFSGSLHVKEGTLHLRNPDYYTWFRFVVKSNLGSLQTRLYELGLFDGSSNRVPFTALNTFADSRGNLQYGEAALIRDGNLKSTGPFGNLFDENSGTYALFQLKPVKENENT